MYWCRGCSHGIGKYCSYGTGNGTVAPYVWMKVEEIHHVISIIESMYILYMYWLCFFTYYTLNNIISSYGTGNGTVAPGVWMKVEEIHHVISIIESMYILYMYWLCFFTYYTLNNIISINEPMYNVGYVFCTCANNIISINEPMYVLVMFVHMCKQYK